MKRYYGREAAPRGVYLNLATGELVQLHGKVHVLPGDGGVKYVRVPAALAVIGSPFIGLAFVIFLPLAGIVGIMSVLVYKAGRGLLFIGRRALQPAMIGWKPGRAYLARRGSTFKEGKTAVEVDKALDHMSITEIEKEIARRRQRGEK